MQAFLIILGAVVLAVSMQQDSGLGSACGIAAFAAALIYELVVVRGLGQKSAGRLV